MNGKSDPSSNGIAPTFKVVIRLRKHAVTAATPSTHPLCTAIYRHVRQGLGVHHLTASGMWSVPDRKLHINLLKTLFLALKEFKTSLLVKQCWYQWPIPPLLLVSTIKGMGSKTLVYPLLENPLLVYQESAHTNSLAHSRSPGCSPQWITHSSRVVSPPVFWPIFLQWHQP